MCIIPFVFRLLHLMVYRISEYNYNWSHDTSCHLYRWWRRTSSGPLEMTRRPKLELETPTHPLTGHFFFHIPAP